MQFRRKYRIVILGAGNLAFHIAPALKNAGHIILHVYSRTIESALQLAEKTGAQFIINPELVNNNADLYFFTLPDHILFPVLQKTELRDKMLITTSGSIETDIFKPLTSCYGVFYPLQTFSKERHLDFAGVPVFIEASDSGTEVILFRLGRQLVSKVTVVTREQRQILHLVAVFAGNFSNHMYSIADNILKNNNLTFDFLKPLITEVSAKISGMQPLEAQTGPAARNDLEIIQKHIDLLSGYPEFQKIYRFVSDSIQKMEK